MRAKSKDGARSTCLSGVAAKSTQAHVKSYRAKNTSTKNLQKRAIRRYTLHRSCVMGSPCKQSSATLSLSLSLSLYPADSTRGICSQRVRHTRATLGSDAAAGTPGEACSQRVNASYSLTRSGGRSWDREASHAMEVCSQRVGCEQRVAHMHRQKSGLRSFCRWGVANRGCELGALRPSPAGLKAASVWLVKS